MPEVWESDEAYKLDQRAMDLLQNYRTDDPIADEFDAGRDWGPGLPAPKLHTDIEKVYAEKIKEYPSVDKDDKPVLILMAGAGGIGKTIPQGGSGRQIYHQPEPSERQRRNVPPGRGGPYTGRLVEAPGRYT